MSKEARTSNGILWMAVAPLKRLNIDARHPADKPKNRHEIDLCRQNCSLTVNNSCLKSAIAWREPEKPLLPRADVVALWP